MKAQLEATADAVQTVESLRLELERSEHRLAGCRQRMAQMEGLFAHVADAIFVAEPDGRIIDVNPAACSLLGYARDELLALHPWDFVTSASREEILSLSRKMRPRVPVTVQRTYRSKAGEQKIMDLRLTRCDLAGRDLIIVSCRDVTERKRLEDRLRQSQRNLAEGQRLTKTGSWILDFKTGNTDWSVETCRIFGFPDPPPSPPFSEFRARVRPEDRDGVDRGLRESFETGEPRPLQYVFVLPDGGRKHIETISQPVRDETGAVVRLMGTVMDVTERKRAEALLAGEKRILEMIARGDALAPVLEVLCRLGEEMCGGTLVSILLVDADGTRLRHGAAPSLPQSYTAAIDGGLIGPHSASCGTAAYRKEPVNVSDIAADPLWTDYRHLALAEGLRACWSTPVFSTTRQVIGTFALYAREPGGPTPQLQGLIEQFAHLASIAIERERAATALQASEHLARGQLNALTHALDAIAMESEPDKFLEHVLRTIAEQLAAHSCSVWQREETSGRMTFEFAFENGRLVTRSDATVAAITPALKIEDVWPWPEVFRTGRPYVLEDIRTGPSFPWREHVLSLGVITILIVPMSIAGQVEGVIGIRFTRQRAFRAEEMELAQALANQAMLAMQLTRLSAQSRQSAVIAERNRMARDIHDTLAQGFTGVIVQLEAAADATSKGLAPEAEEHLGRAGELARESLREARRSVQALRPQALEDKDLSEALESLLHKMTAGTPVRAEFILQGKPRKLPPGWEDNLLRIGQEVLTNALRHARASHFAACLEFEAHGVRLELRDNGRGFDPESKHDGFGLLGMRERVESMGGRITILSAPGTGTAISIVLPRRNDSGMSTEGHG